MFRETQASWTFGSLPGLNPRETDMWADLEFSSCFTWETSLRNPGFKDLIRGEGNERGNNIRA